MLIKFFRNGKGAGAGPVGYLIADKVLAYLSNQLWPLARRSEPLPKAKGPQECGPEA